MTHEEYKELLAANALTALDAEDTRLLDTHLEGCVDCRSEMNHWEQTAAFLALDAKAIEPPRGLRERILATVKSADANDKSIPKTSDVGTEVIGSQDPKILAFEHPRKNRWNPVGSLGSLAASLALAALIISLAVLWQQKRSSQAKLARLSTEIQLANEELAHQREAVELMTSPGARMELLSGTNVAPGAHAMLAYDKNGRAMLMAKGLPAVPKGMAYQLWFIVGKKPMPGKVFRTDASGNANLKDQLPAMALGSAVFAVTLEPESGMKSPTGAMYLSSTS